MNLLSNPELQRNYRAALRPGRMAAVAVIVAALSLSVGYAYYSSNDANIPPGNWGREFFALVLWAQLLVLVVGGGFACLLAISREKEHNTFDFQRVTRLSPVELAVGKLLGAPAPAQFVTICLMPAAIVGAVVGRMGPDQVLAIFGVFFISAIAWHAFAVLISLLIERNSAATGGLLYLILLGLLSNTFGRTLQMLTPFYAVVMLEQTEWAANPNLRSYDRRFVDFFFGAPVDHAIVLIVLSLITLAWVLLALARNIKRDPAAYELYTPWQSLGLALTVNLVLVGFFDWESVRFASAHSQLLMTNLILFFGLGMAVLRNRDRLRRRFNEVGPGASGWLAAFWPGTYLIGGFAATGLGIIGVITIVAKGDPGWSPVPPLVALGLCAMWLARDVLFIQWMYLTRVKRALMMAVLYLIVFYTCATVLLGTLGLLKVPAGGASSAIFLPFLGLALDDKAWEAHAGLWLLALAMQFPIVTLLAWLQRQKLQALVARRALPTSAAAPAAAD